MSLMTMNSLPVWLIDPSGNVAMSPPLAAQILLRSLLLGGPTNRFIFAKMLMEIPCPHTIHTEWVT